MVSSQEYCWDTDPCALLKSSPIAENSFWKNKKIKYCQNSQYGTILEHSTEDRGKAKPKFSAEDSHAKTSQTLDNPQKIKKKESKAKNLHYGKSMRELLEKLNLKLSLPKIPLCFELGDLESYSKTWPKWALMQDGVCLELGTSVQFTKEKECGFWPTPQAGDYKGAGKNSKFGQRMITYKIWSDGEDFRTAYPNPTALEAVMKWPISWTELNQSETDKFLKWLQLHFPYYPKE